MSDFAATRTENLLGTVIAVQANFYQVRLDSPTFPTPPTLLLCTRRTRLKKIGQQVMVGDRVVIAEPDYQNGGGVIAEVLPRKTELLRPPVANAEQILLVFAIEEPTLDPWQLSRFLIKAESTSLDLCLCLNKSDLISEKQRQQWQQRLGEWGYDPVFISVMGNQGLDNLLIHLQQKITIVAGPSGVGKSSLINQLIPEINQRIGKVSGKLQKGRHTTRHVELFELPGGGLLADTPGFNQPDIDGNPTDLAWYFPEAKKQLEAGNCQFNNCSHRDEPNCIVRGNWERYEYYLTFLQEAITKQEAIQQMGETESNLKRKSKASGEMQYEPKLETKKYRRHSRKTDQQTLQALYENQTLREVSDDEEDRY